MKKKIYIVLLIIIIFILPSLLTKKTLNYIKDQEEDSYIRYDYSKFSKIKLYHSKTGETEIIPIDEYLYGVVSAEMPVNYEVEALKAQAIVARTYTIYQIAHGSFKHGESDICDDPACCQAWISKEDRFTRWGDEEAENNWNKILNAVDSTQGQIITYNKEPIDAFFHSNSGGHTEIVSNVWGGSDLPYLQSVETSGEEGYTQYSSEVNLTKKDFENIIREKYSDLEINWSDENVIKILDYTEAGRVKTIKIGNKDFAATELRMLLGLKSTNFTYVINENNIIFSVIGYGHGVGLSQTGADSMAKKGCKAEEIIKHFYTGVEIVFENEL